MICNCGGILFVIKVEESPKILKNHEKSVYNRVCDVQCGSCKRIFYSQPYDFGKRINEVKSLD